jgi:endonuclease/exonuclease/phosphatase family metal-dependent hydrolase
MDIRFVSNLSRSVSLKTVASELAKYNLDLMAVQEVRWDKVGSQPADDWMFSYGNGNANHQLWTGFFVQRESDQQLRG